jgi:hypothetical protein
MRREVLQILNRRFNNSEPPAVPFTTTRTRTSSQEVSVRSTGIDNPGVINQLGGGYPPFAVKYATGKELFKLKNQNITRCTPGLHLTR